MKFQQGFSDHLPVYLDVFANNKLKNIKIFLNNLNSADYDD